MRKAIVWLGFAVLCAGPLEAAGATNAPTVRLVVSLTDGSRLLGTTGMVSLLCRSAGLGRLQIPLAKVRRMKFAVDHESAALALANGDRLQVSVDAPTLALRTVVGDLSIPLATVTVIEVDPSTGETGLQAGLVAYYPFNGDADDHSGHGNHGKVVGASFEQIGLRFVGDASSYVVVRRAEALEPAEAMTVSMWIKGVPGQEAGHGWGTILRKGDHCQAGYGIRGGGISSFGLGGENPCAGGPTGVAAFRRFDETRWQHIAATYSAADRTIRTFQDGALVNEATYTGPLLHTGDLYLGGAIVFGDDGGFRGLISEVRLYNRALFVAEIRALAAQEPVGR